MHTEILSRPDAATNLRQPKTVNTAAHPVRLYDKPALCMGGEGNRYHVYGLFTDTRMKCMIVDDEPLARKGMQRWVGQVAQLELLGSFNSAETAAAFLESAPVDLVFPDIQMPGIDGIEFARRIPRQTLIIFTTAYSEYALDSYEVDAIGYLVKPIDPAKFRKAVDKAITYRSLLLDEEAKSVEQVAEECIFVKSDRRFFKVNLKDILFICYG